MTMIEKVAIVLNDEVFKVKGQSIIEWKDTPDNIKERVRYVARCMIAAMREPTDEMSEAGLFKLETGTVEEVWRAMIDAALKE